MNHINFGFLFFLSFSFYRLKFKVTLKLLSFKAFFLARKFWNSVITHFGKFFLRDHELRWFVWLNFDVKRVVVLLSLLFIYMCTFPAPNIWKNWLRPPLLTTPISPLLLSHYKIGFTYVIPFPTNRLVTLNSTKTSEWNYMAVHVYDTMHLLIC